LKIKDPFYFEKIILNNGTEIYYRRTNTKETEIRLLFKAGGKRYEEIGKEGCAHLLEHCLFKRTARFPNELSLQKYVLRHFLDVNAVAENESICLMGHSYSRSTPLFILMGELLNPRLEQKDIEEEKLVIAQEMDSYEIVEGLIKMRKETAQTLYRNHPYAKRAIEIGKRGGILQSLKLLTLEDLERYYKKYFIAQNLAFIVITNRKLKEIESNVEEFLNLPSGERIEYPRPLKDFPDPKENLLIYSLSALTGSKKIEEMGELVELFAVIPAMEAKIGWSIIRETLYRTLFQKLRIKKNLVYYIDVIDEDARDITTLKIGTKVPFGKSEEIKELILNEINNFKKRKKLFELLKKKRIFTFKSLQPSVSTVIDSAKDEITLYDQVITLRDYIKEITDFSFEEATKLTERWLNPEHILVRILIP
jgi:predicted Zn-dependent peptidase